MRAMSLAFLAAAALWLPACGEVQPLRVEGRVAAAFTPFAPNGSVAVETVPSLSRYLEATHVDYVFIGGTTGESLSLTIAERMALVEAWAPMPQTMIVHVGAEAIDDARTLARHAREHGAKALACMPSVFFKPATVDILAKWLQAVGAAAPDLPLYYYHIPSMTGAQFLMMDLLPAIERAGVPSFAGVKYTGLYETRAFPDMQRCMSYKQGRYEFLSGREEMTVEALSLGVRGFIGSQFNFAGDLYKAIGDAWPHGPYLALQAHALDLLVEQLGLPAGVNSGKLTMEFAGIPMGPSRLPSVDLDAGARNNYFDQLVLWCNRGERQLNLTLQMCGHKRVLVV